MLVLEVGMLLGICGAASEDFKLEINNLFHCSPATENVVVRERFSGAGPDNVDGGVRLNNLKPLGPRPSLVHVHNGSLWFCKLSSVPRYCYIFVVCVSSCVHLIHFYAFS